MARSIWPVTPYYQDEAATLYHGDALAVLAELPAAHVDAVMTDPPYSSGGMVRGDRIQDVHTKYVQSDSESGKWLSAFSGDNRDSRGYGYWCALWLSECLRITKPGGICALFTDWRQLPVTTDALQAGGWVWRGIVPWYKPAARPTQGRWANSCEYLAWGTNGPRELDGHAFPGFYQASPPPSSEREHITQKPVAVLRDMLRVVPPGGTVLDPFCGSGTTLEAAAASGRRAIGVELHDHFIQIAARRCALVTHEPELFAEVQA